MKTMAILERIPLLKNNSVFGGGIVAVFTSMFLKPLPNRLNLLQRKWESFSTIPSICLVFLIVFATTTLSATESGLQHFVLVRGGEFTMGSPVNEFGRDVYKLFDIEATETQHQVKVSDFYMCKYSVTLAEFRKFIQESGYLTDAEKRGESVVFCGDKPMVKAGVNWRHGVSGTVRPQSEENHPVLHVSWNDAVAYCQWMTAKTGRTYRLPTEAEREYACRAGTRTAFNTGENLTTEQANYNGNYPYKHYQKGVYRQNTVPVNTFAPNAWGLYNMHGNIWEWCSDFYGGSYYDECKAAGVVTNPTGPVTGFGRILRGGGWGDEAQSCRSAYRHYPTPDYHNYSIGFRIVLVP